MSRTMLTAGGKQLTSPHGTHLMFYEADAANDAVLEVVRMEVLEDDNGGQTLSITFGTSTGITRAYIIMSDLYGYSQFITIESPQTDESISIPLELTLTVDEGTNLYFRLQDDTNVHYSRVLTEGQIIYSEIGGGGGDALEVDLLPIIEPVFGSANEAYLYPETETWDAERIALVQEATGTRQDVTVTHFFARDEGGGTYTPLNGGVWTSDNTIPQDAIPGATGTAQVVPAATITTIDGSESVTAYGAPMTITRLDNARPAALSLSVGNVGSVWINEEQGIYRDAYSDTTGKVLAWSFFDDPNNLQIEPMDEYEEGEYVTAAGFSSLSTQGQRVAPSATAGFRIFERINGRWTLSSNNAGTAGGNLVGPPGGGGGGIGPVATATGKVKQLTSRTAYDVNTGCLGGWGEQTCIGGTQSGDKFSICGDMNGVNASRDRGKTWHPRPMRGYFANAGLIAFHHPSEPDRLLVVANNAVLPEDGFFMKGGLYVSENDGDDFTHEIALRNTREGTPHPEQGFPMNFEWYYKQVQYNFQWFDACRSDPSVTWGIIQQRCANFTFQSDKSQYVQAGLYRSDNHGAPGSWYPVIAFPNINPGSNRNNHDFGHIWILRVDPLDPEHIFIGCEGGLLHANNPTSESDFSVWRGHAGWQSRGGAWSNMNSGVLANHSCRSFWISDDGQRFRFSIDYEGVYGGENGLSGQINRYWNAGGGPSYGGRIFQVAISPVDPDNMWVFRGARAAGTEWRLFPPLFTENRGGAWNQCDEDLEGIGRPIPQHHRLNGENVSPFPSPTDAKTIIVDRGNIVMTVDGLQFLKWCNGWTGGGARACHIAEDDPSQVSVGVTDKASWYSADYGTQWVSPNARGRGDYGGPSNAPGEVVVVLPGNRGWLCGYGNGRNGGRQFYRNYYDGPDLEMEQLFGGSQHQCIRALRDANNVITYIGRRRSNNSGDFPNNSPNIGGQPGSLEHWFGVVGVSPITSGVCWGVSLDDNTTQVRVSRSTNYGASWNTPFTITDTELNTNTFEGSQVYVEGHPTNDDLAYVHTKTEVYRVNGVTGQVTALGFRQNSINYAGRPLWINSIVVDINAPGIIYVALNEFGGFCPVWRTTDEGATWEDVSGQVGETDGELENALSVGATSFTIVDPSDPGNSAANEAMTDRYASEGAVLIDGEYIEYAREAATPNTFTIKRRGARQTESEIQLHPAGTSLTDFPMRGFVPCFECRALTISRVCGTVLWVGRGSGWYVIAPPYGAEVTARAGELYNNVVTAENFENVFPLAS